MLLHDLLHQVELLVPKHILIHNEIDKLLDEDVKPALRVTLCNHLRVVAWLLTSWLGSDRANTSRHRLLWLLFGSLELLFELSNTLEEEW